jgi:hypothetical protein
MTGAFVFEVLCVRNTDAPVDCSDCLDLLRNNGVCANFV